MKKFSLKSKKGSTLMYVLIVFFVLTILGTGFLSVATVSTNIATVNYNTNQAYYTARSAVDGTISYLDANMVTQTIVPALNASPTISDTMTNTNLAGKYRVKIERLDGDRAKITATAKVNNITSSASAVIDFTLYGQSTAKLEKYAAFLKGNGSVNCTIALNDLIYSNFIKSPFTYAASNNISLSNLTTADFNSIPDSETSPDPGWNSGGSTIHLNSGGIYKLNGDLTFGRDTTFVLYDNDVFLFVNGNVATNKYVEFKRADATKTGTFFLIICGTNNKTFNVSQGAKALNESLSSTPSLMANLFVYGPDATITTKNKYYYKGGIIAYDYNEQGSKNNFNTAYFKASALINGVTKYNVSPWAVLFDKFNDFDIEIFSPTSGSVNNITWDDNYTEIPIS